MKRYFNLLLVFLIITLSINAATPLKKKLLKEAKQLEYPSFFLNKIKVLECTKGKDITQEDYLVLEKKINLVYDLQTQLKWLNLTAIKAAMEDMRKLEGYDYDKKKELFGKLTELVKSDLKAIYKGDTKAIQTAQKVLQLKRNILLDNPLLNHKKIVSVRYCLNKRARQAMAPELGTPRNNWSNLSSASRQGFNAEIVLLSDLSKLPEENSIFKPENGSCIADLRLHWNAKKLMFTATQKDKRWNLWQMNVDGTQMEPLIETVEDDLDFYDGTFLPDGRILAISNIGYQGVPCVNGNDAVGNLVLYNPKNKKLRRLTFDQDANWNPVVMNSGKVMYTRWEYTDLMHYYSRFIMSMNPDGTEQKALYGSGSSFPNSVFDIQPLPNYSNAFVGIISGHHGVARSGRIILFDPTKSRKGVAGMIQEIPYHKRQIKEVIKDRLVDGVWPQFIKPFPINETYFLVAAKPTAHSLWGLYLVDTFDNMTCLIENDGQGYISPILLSERVQPPTIPDRVQLDKKEATVFIQDIYVGEGLRGVPRGTVKSLRLHAYEYAYVKSPSNHNWHGIQSGWDLKRELGTVPVEEDGSVIFKVPANTPISIQPLDKDGAAIQWMRSWFTGQPGEIVSCIGCHENQNEIVLPKRVIASQRAPHLIKKPEGGVRSFTFDLEVQPVLNEACISCHNGTKSFDLTGGKKDRFGFSTSYLNLHPYIHRQGPEADMAVLQPYEYHVNTSELIRLLKQGHHGVQLLQSQWEALYQWVDYNAPDKGFFTTHRLSHIPYKGYDSYQRRIDLTNKYGVGMGVDWKKELTDYAAFLKTKLPQKSQSKRKSKRKKRLKKRHLKGWPFTEEVAKQMQIDEPSVKKELILAPGIKMTFVRIPSGKFIMGSQKGNSVNQPETKVAIKKAFWMSEIEVTNEQYNFFFPSHDSRYVDQLWKDHVNNGYPANLPYQPVIRVSYLEAMAYCDLLSKQFKVSATLPTEAQWEWACRAGSDTDFWFGNHGTDYGKYENLADKSCNKMAVIGVDPKPMSKKNIWYPYYAYLPKDEAVNDGCMIQGCSKQYFPNPFGLYSMHGNIAEWTRSDYLPYPYKEKKEKNVMSKVVRGGSYIERATYSTSYVRKAYFPFQRVFNVGFRIIIEE